MINVLTGWGGTVSTFVFGVVFMTTMLVFSIHTVKQAKLEKLADFDYCMLQQMENQDAMMFDFAKRYCERY